MAQKANRGIPVAPSVLIWARTSSGHSLEAVAKAIGVTPHLVKEWEKGTARPSIHHLEGLAEKAYKRPLAALLLPRPPDEPPFPADLRTVPEAKRQQFSPGTQLAIRSAVRLQQLAGELGIGTTSSALPWVAG